ncbi:hypothetical protein [Enterococcus ureasiticus]|uniref:Uncharacterized protein n=1 Tax=Enterococcus ureasiticus TaxID=903984 RepID=A0A1E5GMX6_9ENTE|nr:hypothetical protein [Enterococcus ureasiticus]OEG14046.1 hypothetical protein BCR21_03380 [Enterococcus ureasiticus]
MNNVHDYIIKSYTVNFEEKKIILEVSNDIKEKQVVFHNIFTYKFYDEMPYSVILDLEERPLDNFFSENEELLQQGEKSAWPIIYDSFGELENEIRNANVAYQVLYSSYGMNGWVLAKRVEIIDVK